MKRLWVALLLLCTCGDPELLPRTQVVVALYADAELEPLLQRVAVEVRDESGATLASEHSFDLPEGATKFPLSFGVHQPADGADWFLLVVRAYSAGDAPLVEYKVIAQFIEGATGLLSVSLSARCAGVACEGQTLQSCYAEFGTCVPVTREKPVPLPDGHTSADAQVDFVDLDASTPDAAVAPPSVVAPPVPPTTYGASTLGGRRGDGTVTVSGDGFESADRRCTSDGRYCVTGSLMP